MVNLIPLNPILGQKIGLRRGLKIFRGLGVLNNLTFIAEILHQAFFK